MRGQVTFPWVPPPGRVGRRAAQRASSLVPRMAPAAVRIPDPRVVEFPFPFVSNGPQIFVHEGARQAIERRFVAACPHPFQLAITDNRNRMVTYSLQGGVLRVRIHMMFLGAPDAVLDALVRYVLEDQKEASQLLGEFIQANSHRIRASRAVVGPLATRGQIHDLMEILSRVNAMHFASSLTDVLITWGRRTRPRSKKRSTIKLGSYSATERLVRIHPALDQDWVPRYFVSYIVYHELLHHLVPAELRGGRIILHPPEFVRREREFRYYERALEWERKHINRLLRAR